ncbi:hypothetical protein ACRAWF_02090 [Streptomyces sp. L7]
MSAPAQRRIQSDTLAGYITYYSPTGRRFGLRTSDEREFTVHLPANAVSRIVRNLGDDYRDYHRRHRRHAGRGPLRLRVRHPLRVGGAAPGSRPRRSPSRRRPAASTSSSTRTGGSNRPPPSPTSICAATSPTACHDWRGFRTHLTLRRHPSAGLRRRGRTPETDTISRLVYGLATAYLLTGKDRFLEAAEAGTEYLREHMRVDDTADGITYWYHGIDITASGHRPVFASEFGDDFDAIPMYEQIYALAGPTQTFRITGDPRILQDIDRTVELFQKYFRDPVRGGFSSHLDLITMDPNAELAGPQPVPQELELWSATTPPRI